MTKKGQKAADTRKKKQDAMMKELGFERKKIKRKRKPMTEEQKKAAAERLAKAREARGHTGLKTVHHSIRDLPEDDFLHPLKVKEWIKSNELKLRGMISLKTSSKWQERSEYIDLQTYIKNMKSYLSTGHWGDFRWGENMEHRVQKVCVAMSYHPDGTPNRTMGVFYPDIGQTWTKELQESWYGEDDPRRVHATATKLSNQEEILGDGGDGSEDEQDDLY